jgi:hypothetical protein
VNGISIAHLRTLLTALVVGHSSEVIGGDNLECKEEGRRWLLYEDAQLATKYEKKVRGGLQID